MAEKVEGNIEKSFCKSRNDMLYIKILVVSCIRFKEM